MQINGKVILIMYDNPVSQPALLKHAEKFRKGIKRMGFLNLQKSIYVKIVRNRENIATMIDEVSQSAPEKGNIKMLVVPLGIFKKLINVRGEEFNMKMFADEVIVI